MGINHTITIEITQEGKVVGEVKGVQGQQCMQLSEWIGDLGEVLEDKKTPDYFKQSRQTITTKR